MKRVAASLVISLLVLVWGTPTQAQSTAPVLAYYYAWWAPQALGEAVSPDWPPDPYHSWDQAVMNRHVSQAAGAGLDALLVAWYGPTEENNQTETNFRYLLDQGSANGIKMALSVDLGSGAWFTDTQQIVEGLRYALDVHAQHPAYFRYGGKPVLFFWFQQRYSLDEWAAIREQVDPNRESIWIAEGIAPDAIGVFDGLHLYTIAWADNVYTTLGQWEATVRGRGGIWVATAMPGWDNTYTQQSERYIRERANGAFYRDTFAAAAATNPEMIVITSWNEWWEGTHIEPSVQYGDFYLNLTRDLISEYRASGGVAGGGDSPPPQQPTALPTEIPPTPVPSTPAPTATPQALAPPLPTATMPPPTETPVIPSSTPQAAALLPPTQALQPSSTPIAGETNDPPQPDSHDWIVIGVGGFVMLLGMSLVTGAAVLLLREL